MRKRIKRLAVLASGNGSTLQAVIDAIESKILDQKIVIVISDNPNAYALERARINHIETYTLNSKTVEERDNELWSVLEDKKIDLILLLGYLKLIGPKLIKKYTIINTHPSLIPKHCGKGMYGMKVHEDVYKSHDKETGVTLHFVNENYDEGSIIWQSHVPVFKNDTPVDISERVQIVEKAQLIWALKAFRDGKIFLDNKKNK